MEEEKIISLSTSPSFSEDISWKKESENDKINNKEKSVLKGDSMSQETYTKNEIDLKFENLSDKVDNKFELLSQKIDSGFSNQSLQMNNTLLEFKQALKDESEKERKERQNEKKELIKWSIGTAIAIVAAVAALLALT
ncbi:hypothetical protein [Lactococcus lactis]|uniref:hypothetical protein n=1 Tax=Lactococcus lactis TaxID=1358 RepID=UPI00071E0333|nr:hypothetical protein [Lactococcus lactis]KST92620.1 hypothetical protein LKF24_1664 [Lactococcus lactis subsp. lactis]